MLSSRIFSLSLSRLDYKTGGEVENDGLELEIMDGMIIGTGWIGKVSGISDSPFFETGPGWGTLGCEPSVLF